MVTEVDLKRELLRLLREDEEFRLAVAGLLGLDAVLSELRKLREDFNKLVELEDRRWEENRRRWEENNKRWEENEKRWQENWRRWEENEKRWEENNKRWEENWRLWQENMKRWEENERRWQEAYKRFEVIEEELRRLREDHNKLREDFNRAYADLSRRLDALGARWGIISEEAFREGMRGVVENILGVAKVGRWVYHDTVGEVYGRPSVVEVDVVVKDGEHVLVEVKSSISRGDVYEFWRVAELYRRVTGAIPRLVIISPYVDSKARELAESLGIEVYTRTS